MKQTEIDSVLRQFIHEIFHECKTREDFRSVQRRIHEFVDRNEISDEQMKVFIDSNAGEMMNLYL